MIALIELGTERKPCLRKYSIVAEDFHRCASSKQRVPSYSSQYLGISENNPNGCFRRGQIDQYILHEH